MSGPSPAVATARSAVRAALADLPPGSRVLVACSGGADSLALAAATAFVTARAGIVAGAVVVDHGLQAGSAAVAARAAEQCTALGLAPVEVVTVEVGSASEGGGPEAAARTARYAALDEAGRRAGAVAVLLGHTLDDQAESVLLGLARGSGARSLAGMPPTRGLLRRPFLGLRRATTEQVCADLGLTAWDDPTNGLDAPSPPLRSRVRHRALPLLEEVLGPGVAEALARTADQLREDADVLDALAADLVARARQGTPDEHPADEHGADKHSAATVRLVVDVLAAAPAALRRRAVRVALVSAGCPAGSLHHVHVEAVDALLTGWHGQGPVSLPGGLEVVRRYGTLVVLSSTT